MGEMADYYNEIYADDDYYEAFEEESELIITHNKACKYCGMAGLKWSLTKLGWRLLNKEHKIHNCIEYAFYDKM